MTITSYSFFGSDETQTKRTLAAKLLFAEQAIALNASLAAGKWDDMLQLPVNISMMNPFQTDEANTTHQPAGTPALQISSEFYKKYYADKNDRYLILGINPGRNGAGLTGIPFTDSERLHSQCCIETRGIKTYEMSAEYIYKLIAMLGGVEKFYSRFYINSPLPLGLLQHKISGKSVNANYYDSKLIHNSVMPLINMTMNSFDKMKIRKATVFVLGNSKNFECVNNWNTEHKVFGNIVPLPHPRYVMQYKRKQLKVILQQTAEQLNNVI